ncbi:MAG: outer membrane lipoprotein-sorting protein, partial [Myxococcota bacterium]
FLTPALPLRARDSEPGREGLDAGAIVRRAESMLESGRTFLQAKLILPKGRLRGARELRFRSHRDRPRKRSFVRIFAPPALAGTSFLLLHPNLWAFDPGTEQTSRTAARELRKSWMESDFTLDDLLIGTVRADSYDHRLLGVEPQFGEGEPVRAYVVESVPQRPGPALWPEIVTWIETERGIARRQEFRDADGESLRVIEYGDVRAVEGRSVPHLWIASVPDDSSRESRIEIEAIRFDAEFDDSVFTTENLRPAD